MPVSQNYRIIKQLRFIGLAEGVSFILLLFVAMPLKYFFGYAAAVKVNGWIHGLLFISYLVCAVRSAYLLHWNFARLLIAMTAAVVPFATFVLDRKLKRNPRIY